MTCTRAREFLARSEVTIRETIDARAERLGPEEALALARRARSLVAVRGKKVVRLDPRKASKEDLLAVLLGPSGSLRAPTLRRGESLVVGFDPDVYAELLGASA